MKAFIQLDMKPGAQEGTQTGFLEPQKSSGAFRIKEILDLKLIIPVKGANIIIRPVKNFSDFRIIKEYRLKGKGP